MTSHVHTISKEQFKANFIPHDPGRHRVDVKFNGEKVPNSPWFVEVKDPNTPLLAPMLVANRGSGMNGSKNGSTQDLSKISNTSYSNKLNSELKQSSLFQQNKVESNNFSSSYNTSSSSKFESNLSSLKNGVEDLSLSKKKQNSSNSDFQKTDFGSYSLLETPKLLSGSKSSSTTKTFEEERKLQSSTSEHLNNSGSFTTPKTTYSTTIERSINTGNTGYSSLNKPHEARVKGLTNGSSTMPKSSTLNTERRALERRSSLHAKIASAESNSNNTTSNNKEKGSKLPVATNGNGHHSAASASFSKTSSHDAMSSYNATSASTVQTSFKSSQQSSSSRAVQESSSSASVSGSKSFGPGSPKLSSYKGTAEKCKFVGETVRHFNAGKPATFELFAPGAKKGDVDVNIISEYHLFLNEKFVSFDDSGRENCNHCKSK